MHTATENDPHLHKADHFPATINELKYEFKDPVPTARQMLDKADFRPADDCVLIQVLAHGTVGIGLDQMVDLRQPGIEVFWAFKTDRVYRFTVDERGFEWGSSKIKEPLLRMIAHVKPDEVLVLERKDQPDLILGSDDEVNFAEPGTEHLRTEKRLVKVFFKDQPYELPAGVYTTEELMAKFPIEQGYLLNLKTPDGELVTLKPHEKIRIECGMHFYSQVNGGGSS
jgi:hypothetical protein